VHKNQGKVPSYINKYNKQREDAVKQKVLDEENAKLPPGTRLMQEDERRATLEDLISAKKITNDQIERLPITNKSLKMISHRRELEEKMSRLEKAIDTFSKPKVYVQI